MPDGVFMKPSDATSGASSKPAGSVLIGLTVGLFNHTLAVVLFFLFWQSARIEAPRCFPDEDGVAGVLLQTLAVDAIGSVACGVVAVLLQRQRFTRGLVAGWIFGLVLVVAGTVEILRFRASLGMGCGSGVYHAPW